MQEVTLRTDEPVQIGTHRVTLTKTGSHAQGSGPDRITLATATIEVEAIDDAEDAAQEPL